MAANIAPSAAVGLATVMLLAIAYHARRRESPAGWSPHVEAFLWVTRTLRVHQQQSLP
jgi:hypothetical protein